MMGNKKARGETKYTLKVKTSQRDKLAIQERSQNNKKARYSPSCMISLPLEFVLHVLSTHGG